MDENGIEKIRPADRVEFVSQDYPQRHQKKNQGKSSKDSKKKDSTLNYQKLIDEQNKNAQEDSRAIEQKPVNVNDVKQYIEGSSTSQLYRLLSMVKENDTESAIRYLAELSKKDRKRNKTQAEIDDAYNR